MDELLTEMAEEVIEQLVENAKDEKLEEIADERKIDITNMLLMVLQNAIALVIERDLEYTGDDNKERSSHTGNSEVISKKTKKKTKYSFEVKRKIISKGVDKTTPTK